MRIIRKSGYGLLILVFLAAVSKSIAVAGDYASRDIIGFSPDGTVFAFEQYGIQDGSGFPYSEIFIIDTRKDSWVKDSPVKVLLKNENSTVNAARRRAKSEAEPLLAHFRVSEPGEHLASNPRAEISADPHNIVINTAYQMTPPVEEPVRFSIDEQSMDSSRCSAFTDTLKGFVLTMQSSGDERVLHEDKRLPESRGCPLGYSFADIYRHVSGNTETYAVLLHMLQVGFEGPDGRFLAVTTRLP